MGCQVPQRTRFELADVRKPARLEAAFSAISRRPRVSAAAQCEGAAPESRYGGRRRPHRRDHPARLRRGHQPRRAEPGLRIDRFVVQDGDDSRARAICPGQRRPEVPRASTDGGPSFAPLPFGTTSHGVRHCHARPGHLMDLSYWASSDIGQKRANNEDNFLIDGTLRLFVVADGMGATPTAPRRAPSRPTRSARSSIANENFCHHSKRTLGLHSSGAAARTLRPRRQRSHPTDGRGGS